MQGIDISAYQPNVNFAQVKAAGIEIVYIKATDSITYINPCLKAQYQGAKAAGLKVGFYHFFHANVDPIQQAQYFLKAIAGMPYNCRLVMDIELNYGVAAPALSAAAESFLQELGMTAGVSPTVYTYTAFIVPNLTNALARYPLWLADYSKVPGSNPVWSSYDGWQYSEQGSIPGIRGAVDLDQFSDDVLLVIIEAGSSVVYGKIINGETWGPVANVCKAKGILYTWDAAKQIVCINGASDANVAAKGLQVMAGSQVIAGELLGGVAWCPIAKALRALGINYTWDQESLTLVC